MAPELHSVTLHRRGDTVTAHVVVTDGDLTLHLGDIDVTQDFTRLEIARHEREYRNTSPGRDL